MKVLVTGGCGFLGSHVCEHFRHRDWDVTSYDNMTKSELLRTGYQTEAARSHNWKLLDRLGVEMVTADIRSAEELLDHSSGCDYIVHTAAQPAVTISMEDPINDLSNNVVGTVNVLETARKHGVPVASCASVHVYGNWVNELLDEKETRYTLDPPEIDEDAPTMKGYLTPLHASKASAEHYVQAYASTYGTRAASFRLTGIYGPQQLGGEDHGWVANFTIRNAIGWPITLFGTGKQVRDILYATDAASAFLAFFESDSRGGIFNIGGGINNAISLLECIDLIDRHSGKKSTVEFDDARFGDLSYFVCDITKARNEIGWVPEVRPAQGVPLLADWVEENRALFTDSGN